jgi:hypothetical protein
MNEFIIFSEALRSIADIPDRTLDKILDISKVIQLEKGYCNKEAREREFLLFDAEQRYRSFSTRFRD